MEIAPIAGIRAVALLQNRHASPASQPVFVIEPTTGTANESYTSSNEDTPGRGFEDEGNDAGQDKEAGAGVSVSPKPAGRSVNLFA